MAASTPTYGFPYPTGTDRVMDGDNAIGALALAIENLLIAHALPQAIAAGTGAMGTIAANSGASLAITFPVGRFTQSPIVTTGSVGSGYGATGHGGTTTSGCTLRYWNPTGGSVNGSTHWHALQMLPGAGPGRTIEPMGAETAYSVTCHTEGCPNAGEPLTVLWDHEIDGPELRAACGVCGQPITDTAAA